MTRPRLDAIAAAGRVCKALAKAERAEGDRTRADVLDQAGDICEAKAMVAAVVQVVEALGRKRKGGRR